MIRPRCAVLEELNAAPMTEHVRALEGERLRYARGIRVCIRVLYCGLCGRMRSRMCS